MWQYEVRSRNSGELVFVYGGVSRWTKPIIKAIWVLDDIRNWIKGYERYRIRWSEDAQHKEPTVLFEAE